MADTVMNFRVDEDLKKAFDRVAKELDQSSSQMLRAFMRDTVKEYMRRNTQGELLEPLKQSGKGKVSPKEKKTATSPLPSSWRAK
jgi:predicted transcriptional regulator